MSHFGLSGMMSQISEATKHTLINDQSIPMINALMTKVILMRTRPTASSRSRQFGNNHATKDAATLKKKPGLKNDQKKVKFLPLRRQRGC